ncbi:MAG: cupin [Spirochaetia bacterium]|nr:cupin [Spirochaetia bacterium]
MSVLAIFPETGAEPAEVLRDHQKISKILNGIGVLFEAWEAAIIMTESATPEDILKTYEKQVSRLKKDFNFQAADVISMNPGNADRETLRKKFLSEHTHTDFEIRFFVGGSGLFYLHVDKIVYAVLCESNDLISVPADTPHWFDMGSKPSFQCIRLFTDPAGWIGHSTGSNISSLFPDYDTFAEEFK